MDNRPRCLLMIFAKVPALGKVKTRLAETIGDEMALQVYLRLLSRTHDVASRAEVDKLIFYSEESSEFDMLDYYRIPRTIQKGEGLGERMQDAFSRGFAQFYERIVIIGSDCFELETSHIEEAFEALADHDYVIGPAKDGGYYLLGMTKQSDELFENKVWSSADVFLDTMLDVQAKEASYKLIDTLSDVDREEDLPEELRELVNGQAQGSEGH